MAHTGSVGGGKASGYMGGAKMSSVARNNGPGLGKVSVNYPQFNPILGVTRMSYQNVPLGFNGGPRAVKANPRQNGPDGYNVGVANGSNQSPGGSGI